jgi:hypothetical protein
VVAGDVAVGAVGDRAGHAAEAVPDRLALAVFVGGTLDLERTGRHTLDKAGRETVGKVAIGEQGLGFGVGRPT